MTIGTVLVIDDEPDLRSVYELALVREGYGVDTAGSVGEGKALLETHQYDVVITDMRLPDGLGLEIVKLIGGGSRAEKCFVVTAYGSAENAVEALKAGAFDYLTKPVNLKQLRQVVADAIQSPQSEKEKPAAPHAKAATISPQKAAGSTFTPTTEGRELLGGSAVMQHVREVIKKVAATMAPVLVHGESGTGKELVARAIHQHSHRAQGPFIAVNCGAIPENLMEAEFFGYRKGAFTGANEDRAGLFASAVGGTLFLDEIGELPLSVQAKLLRVIQERSVRPLGAHQEESIDVRIVSATHRNLAQDVKSARFRQDLYYRLNVIEVFVPPLRERKGDIDEIVQALLRRICYESGLPVMPIFEGKALAKLKSYSFPGNVRELENILQRAIALCDGNIIYEHDLMMEHGAPEIVKSADVEVEIVGSEKEGRATSSVTGQTKQVDEAEISEGDLPSNLSEYMDSIEREKLIKALERYNFNRTAAAAQLGMSLRQIRYRMERLNIDVPDPQE
ncbi:MAG: sigma-54-dependent transcriptional regulator [Saezia sp.]